MWALSYKAIFQTGISSSLTLLISESKLISSTWREEDFCSLLFFSLSLPFNLSSRGFIGFITVLERALTLLKKLTVVSLKSNSWNAIIPAAEPNTSAAYWPYWGIWDISYCACSVWSVAHEYVIPTAAEAKRPKSSFTLGSILNWSFWFSGCFLLY